MNETKQKQFLTLVILNASMNILTFISHKALF